MKKGIAILMIASMLLLTVACGGNNGGGNAPDGNGDHQGGQASSGKVTVDSVKSAPETDPSLFECRPVEGGVAITGYSGEAPIVVIPEQMDGADVVAIGSSAFANNLTIKGLKIADTVQVIEESAFLNCFELRVVVSGASLKEIEPYSFCACKVLDTVVLNEGVEVLDTCFTLTNITEIYVPATVTEMVAPFMTASNEDSVTIISEAGSYVEQYVSENGQAYRLTFQAK